MPNQGTIDIIPVLSEGTRSLQANKPSAGTKLIGRVQISRYLYWPAAKTTIDNRPDARYDFEGYKKVEIDIIIFGGL